MSYYKKIPVLDEKEQIEFDNYLTDQYVKDLVLATDILKAYMAKFNMEIGPLEGNNVRQTVLAVFDKLATPRIYLLRDWIHRRQEEKATSDEGWKEHPEDEQK